MNITYKTIKGGLSFGEVFDYIKGRPNYGMRLPKWAPDVVIRSWIPENDKNANNVNMTVPYLYVTSRYGYTPWMHTNIELYSNEWELVELATESDKVTYRERSKSVSDEYKRLRDEYEKKAEEKCNHCGKCNKEDNKKDDDIFESLIRVLKDMDIRLY